MSKKKPVFRATCGYCKFYQPRHICKLSRKKVRGNSLACNDFEMADAFWCNRNGYQVYTAACLNRQDHNYPGCVHCWQGEGIHRLTGPWQLLLF